MPKSNKTLPANISSSVTVALPSPTASLQISAKNRGPFYFYNDTNPKNAGKRLCDVWTRDELLAPNRFVIALNNVFYVIDGTDALNAFVKENANHLFECVLGDKPQKIRFDFDGDLSVYSETWLVKFFDALVMTVISTFQETYKQKIEIGKELIVTDSSLPGKKFSRHIIINQFCLQNAVECKEFYNTVTKQLKSQNRKFADQTIVDSTIYKTFQQFRMLGSCKAGTNRIKLVPDTVTVAGVAYQQNPFSLVDTLLTFTDGSKLLPSMTPANNKKAPSDSIAQNTSSADSRVTIAAQPGQCDAAEPFQLKQVQRTAATLRLLLQIINKTKRMVTRADWVNVGLIIYNEIGALDYGMGLSIYQSFCDAEYRSSCTEVFKSFKVLASDKKIQTGTLASWAKEDCPQLFQHPFKHYIFQEPETFSSVELLQAAATGDSGVYELILSGRKKLGNQLKLYDPNHHVFYNKILQYADQHLTATTISQIKTYLGQTMATIEAGGTRVVMCKTRNDKGEMEFTETTFQNWKNTHSFNVSIDVESKTGELKSKVVPFYKVVEPMMVSLQFERSSFLPYANPTDRATLPPFVFNTFTGFKAEHTLLSKPLTKEERIKIIQPMLNHLKLLCGAEANIAFEYLMCWLAYKFQFPRTKIGIALVMRSQQGAGKNLPFDFLSQFVIGEQYYQYINKIEQITGDFNGLMYRNLFTFLDEIQNYGGAFKSNDLLKSILTQVQQNINKKNIEAFESIDYSHYIFATNNKWPVKVSKDDRRHFCITPSNAKIGDKAYFDDLIKQCFNNQCGRAFYEHLMDIDLTSWNKNKIPQTSFRLELIQFSQSKVEQFLSDSLNDGHFNEPEIKVTLSTLYSLYNSWFTKTGLDSRQHLDKNQLSEELSQFAQEHPKINYRKYNWVDSTSKKRTAMITLWCTASDLSQILKPTLQADVDQSIEFEYKKDRIHFRNDVNLL